jgi:hypothetical protein
MAVMVFLWQMLPETKNRSLEEMSLYFAEVTGDQSVVEAEASVKARRGSAGPAFVNGQMELVKSDNGNTRVATDNHEVI